MRKSKLSTYKQRHLREHFVAGSTAQTATSICNVNHKTAAFYYHRLREVIAYELEQEVEAVFAGEIDVDENYFSASVQHPFRAMTPIHMHEPKRGARPTLKSTLRLIE